MSGQFSLGFAAIAAIGLLIGLGTHAAPVSAEEVYIEEDVMIEQTDEELYEEEVEQTYEEVIVEKVYEEEMSIDEY